MTDILAVNGTIDPVKLANVLTNTDPFTVLRQHNIYVTENLCAGTWRLQHQVATNAVQSVPQLRDYLERRQLAA